MTDEPLPEVATAAHDRAIVTLKPENFMPWLTPHGRTRAELDAMLEDKKRLYHEHRMAA